RIGDCQRILRSTTTKRLDRAAESRCRCTRANIRCEVEEPMSIPTVISSTLSAAQATSLTAPSPGSTCRCSNSRSCIYNCSLDERSEIREGGHVLRCAACGLRFLIAGPRLLPDTAVHLCILPCPRARRACAAPRDRLHGCA